ncbi:MAG: hypothetical protein LBM77_01450 [Spirochaetaceae bacterium]|jgi:hypothetical protein|nr:hypothetical protein [Spirochaetaceae bacterium]
MIYEFTTPYTQLTPQLKEVVQCMNSFITNEWDYADADERRQMVYSKIGHLCGKLDNDELEYLTDCNYHTARFVLEEYNGKETN